MFMESKFKERTIKVIHVHFIHGHKNFYMGSVRVIFRKFTEEEIGCTEDHLRHQLPYDGSTYINDKVIIKRSHLITSKRGG